MGHLGNSCRKVKEKNRNGKVERKREQKLTDDRQEENKENFQKVYVCKRYTTENEVGKVMHHTKRTFLFNSLCFPKTSEGQGTSAGKTGLRLWNGSGSVHLGE